ncbi:MAG: ROK family protein [Chitinophagales bacterium]|nr:ROK family protein [Chitinophagaceae bacterium]MCB9064467.1 ROK family protein [Chitinophagales bacterium]
MNKPFAIGIDIGGTNTALGLVDRRGQILLKASLNTTAYDTVGDYVKAVAEEVEKFKQHSGADNIQGVGVGAPNGNYYTGEIVNAVNMPWKEVIPFATLLKKETELQVTLTNDANATAMGEMMYGAARGMKDFVVVTLGTGVGTGFVANGQLIYGHDGFAGELGHMIAVRDGRDCPCGRKGCLERYCSATGIVITAKEFLADDDTSVLHKEDKLTAKSIAEAANAGDELALKIFEFTAKVLGQTLADAVSITSPQAIILFGGLAQAGKVLFEPTKKYMEENLLYLYKDKVNILPSMLPGADAAVLGASALAW